MTTFNEDVEINGSLDVLGTQDETQLKVRGVAAQTVPLQTWEKSDGSALAQVTADGRLELGDLNLGTADALLEANQDIALPDTVTPRRGLQATGKVTGNGTNVIDGAIAWAVHELDLLGDAVVSGIHTGLRAKVTRTNTSASPQAELRAADFEAVNDAASGTNAVGKLVGVQSKVTNEQAAYLTEAVGVAVQISNEGAPSQLTRVYGMHIADMPAAGEQAYAIHTGEGSAHFGDDLEVKLFAGAPTENPPSGFIKVYSKLDAGIPKLYAKDATGTEHELSEGYGGGPADPQYVTLAAHAGLDQERVLTPGSGLSLTDGGAGSTVTLDVNVDGTTLDIVTDTLQAKNAMAQWNASKLQGLDVAALTPNDGETLAWVAANQWWEPSATRAIHQALFYFPGTVLLGASSLRIYNATGQAKTISKVFVYGNGASGLVVDIHKDGVTIFTNQAHRVTLSGDTGYSTDIDVPVWAANSYLTCEIDTAEGRDVVVHVVYS